MKKFIINLLLFFSIAIVVDYFTGKVFTYLRVHTKGGDTGLANYIHEELRDDVLIFGSSRCFHHYDPNIIGDSLKMSCYNCGMDGMGILCFYQRFKLITDRYTPKVIIYDVYPRFDLIVGSANNKYLGKMRPFFGNSFVQKVFKDVDSNEPYKMMSQAYRYNSQLLPFASDFISPSKSSDKGYRPKDKKMQYEPLITSDEKPYQIDSLKVKYLELLITDCQKKGIKVLFATSPMYKGSRNSKYCFIDSLAKKYDIPYLLYVDDERISNDRDYFYDSSHMNRNGATEYSKMIAHELKKYIR